MPFYTLYTLPFAFMLAVLSPISFASPLITDLNLMQPSPKEDWLSMESPNFSLHYQAQDTEFAQQMAAVAEKVHADLTPFMQWQPSAKTHIVINDTTDQSNGGATPLPYNQFFIYMSPPTEGELLDQTNWIEQVFTHEYTHILHLDQVSGNPEKVRSVFGRTLGLLTPLTFPEIFAPHWSSEGIAIYAESQKGFGRNHNGIYESKMRLEVMRGLRSFSEESYEGYYNSRWPFGQVYLYGAYFYQFIEAQFGHKKLIEYITNYNDNLIPWRMTSRAKRTFGLDNEALWKLFTHYLQKRFSPQIKTIQAQGEQKGKTVIDTPYYNRLITTGPDQSIIYYHDDRINLPEIRQSLANGKTVTLLAIKGVQDLDWDDQKGLLISRNEICQNKNIYSDLYRYSPSSQTLTRLTECARLPRAKWNHDASEIYAVHLDQGRTDLVRLESDGSLLRFAKMAQGETIGEFDLSPDGETLVASVRRATSGWNLELLNLKTLKWQALTLRQDKPSNPQFDQEGKRVYFLADNQQQVELKSIGLADKKIKTWTNSLGYIVDYSLFPAQDDAGFWLTEYTAQNEQLRMVSNPVPFGRSQIEPDSVPDLSRLANQQSDFSQIPLTEPKPYQPLKTLKPVGWQPLLSLGGDLELLGASVSGQDILGFHQYQLTPILFKHSEGTDLGGLFAYNYHNQYRLLANRQFSMETSAFGDDQLETQTLQAYYHQAINQMDWASDLAIGLSIENETHSLTEQDSLSHLIGVQGHYNTLNYFPHGISLTEGWVANLGLETYLGGDYSGSLAKLQGGRYFNLGQGHTLKLEGFFGLGGDQIKPFQLGGATNLFNLLMPEAQIGVREISLRGYAANAALQDNEVQRWTAEYRLPIAKVYDGFYQIPTGIGKIWSSLFVDSGATGDHQYYTGVGVELHAEWLIGYDTLNLPITFGYAQGLDKQYGDKQIYLQIGFSY